MAEISTHNAKGKKTRSNRPIKIDMTPMVDLAFLLLTFFMLANSFLDPKVMDIEMPHKAQKSPSRVNINDVLNIVLSANNKIYYTLGAAENLKTTDYSKKGIRKVLEEGVASNSQLYVLIKATEQAKYHNVVDIFDEIQSLQIKRYALVDPTVNEIDKIKMYNQ